MTTARVRCCPLLLPAFIMLLMIMACANEKLYESFISEPYVRERWLSYLEDGRTKKDEIIRRLGEPTSRFQNGIILGYRLILVEEGGDISEKEYRSIILTRDAAYTQRYYAWVNKERKLLSEKGILFTLRDENKDDKILEILSREAEYSLVLVFDAHGTLAKHDLRRIMP